MGTTLYISLDPPVPGCDPNAADKVFLADLVGDQKTMGLLSKQLGVRSLADFQSYAPENLGDIIGEAELAKLPPAKWFDPAEALPAVLALQSHYAGARFVRPGGRRVGGKSQDVDRTDELLDELQHTESVLQAAADAGARFRFHVGF
jgi:hypothetical protein